MSSPINTDFYDRLIEMNNQTHLQHRVERLWLGGDAGPDGGEGSRPGGFIGKLIQRAIAYDTTEAGTLAGSGTLVDNLNHIRYHLNLFSGILFSGFLGLIDTPNSYAGQGGRVLVVNDAEDGIEFTDTIAGGGGTSTIQGVMRWSTGAGVNSLELPDEAEMIFYVSQDGLIVDPLLYELNDDGTTILLSGTTAGDTVFSSHYLVRVE